jgi:6-phosphofructokinase 1
MFPETFGKVYAGRHGIEGVLKEELIDMSAQSKEDIALLRTTPAAGAIGTCRYKIKSRQQEDLERIIEVFKAHDIGFFFYNGGNDSMDTANKVAGLAKKKGLELVCVGIPKTIDNDVGDSDFKLIDHTPGYGSVARYWANVVQCADEENRGSRPADPVLVLQAMGRKIGFIPAAARLGDPGRKMPLQIYLAESGVSMEQMADNVNDYVKKFGRCIVVVSEGLDVGEIGESKDSFGHTQFSSSKMTVAQAVVNYLNSKGLAAKGSARFDMYGTGQRNSSIYASTVDLDEAYKVGCKAVEIAKDEGNGWMATILREPGAVYNVKYGKALLEKVANSERFFPDEWISKNRYDVTDEFVSYARPLIGRDWVSVPLVDGLQRFARIEEIYAEKKLPSYIPQADRE